MNRSFFIGLASGYAAIAIQAVVGLLLIPFLLSAHGVGLAGYGAIATLQAVAATLSVVFDGYRQDSSRRIAGWMAQSDGAAFPTLLAFNTAMALAVAIVAAAFAVPLAGWLELMPGHGVLALQLVFACFFLEQCCYPFESSLHAARRSWVANTLGAADAVLRATAAVMLFMMYGAAIHWFFAAALIGLMFKAILLPFLCRRTVSAMRGESSFMDEARQFVRSMPLALNGIAPFLVFRVSIIAGNKFLGAEQAGVLGIILVTLRTYLNQAVFSAMRPMLIPRLVMGEAAAMSGAAHRRFIDYITLYQAAIYALAIAMVCSTPWWLGLWLGDALLPFAPFFMVTLAMYFLEMAYGVPYYWLVANGHAHALAIRNGLAATVATGVLLGAAILQLPMIAYVAVVVGYLGIYTLLVRYYFGGQLGSGVQRLDVAVLFAAIAIIAGGWMVLDTSRHAGEVLGISAVATAAFLLACQIAVMTWRELVQLLVQRPIR